jgi:broad specificity phosphatase PhoE
MALSGEGVRAAHELAQHLQRESAGVKHIFTSPFERALHTSVLVCKDLGLPRVNIEDGITEWQTPSLVGREEAPPYEPPSLLDLIERFPEINAKYAAITKPTPFETEDQMVKRVGRIAQILANSVFPSNLLIVTHAPCAIGISLSFEGLADLDASERKRETKLKPSGWPLGGLTEFTRTSSCSSAKWELALCQSTQHLSGLWKEGKQAWTLPSLR